ncbi:MAG: DMT family transporter [Proteobacteria bacterium]|nr:DMT family transporter [Pseudomonadota bacterium]
MPALSARAQGYLFALAAPLCWSVGGVVMRSVEAGPWDIVFWRAAAHFVCYPFVLVFLLRVSVMRSLRDFGMPALVSAAMVGASFVLHVIGMTSTTVANALLLQSTSPLIVAILARFFLGESVPAASWIAIAVAFAGLALVMGASLGEGAILGKLAAIAVAVVSAINVTLIRRTRGSLDLRPAMVPAALIACIAALAVGEPFSTAPRDIAALLGLGVVQMTLGLTFFYAALRRLSPVEVTLIALIEPVLGPLWTWLAVGEEPSGGTLVGGAVLLAALAFNTLVAARRRSEA